MPRRELLGRPVLGLRRCGLRWQRENLAVWKSWRCHLTPAQIIPKARWLPILLLAGGTAAVYGQEIASPDFSQTFLSGPAEDVSSGWMKWRSADQGLEQTVFRLPMREARGLVQRTLGLYLDFVDRRSTYALAVTTFLDRSRTETKSRRTEVTIERAYGNQVDVLGLNLRLLQDKISSLRDSPEWLALRHTVQPAQKVAMALSDDRRANMPIDVSIRRAAAPKTISPDAYRDSEQEMAQVLRRLWTTYYQALIDAAERNPNGPVPLIPVRGGSTDVSSGLPGLPTLAGIESPLVGVWKYVGGSQQFNGVAEPQQVLLEVWTENGALAGRYRAELPDFDGVKKVDLRLKGNMAAPGGQMSFTFDSYDPPATGRIVLEGPGSTGMELLLIRAVSAPSPIPRGREVLQRY